jgi:type VI secretion system ImpA family protein
MPTPPVISDDVLNPISATQPCGEDLQATRDWVDLKNARPNPFEVGDKGIWEPVSANNSSWSLLGKLAAEALQRKSKDLRIAIWLAESNTRLHGFAGLRDGLRLIRELVTRYWDSGLYPPIVDDDVESRCGPLGWLNQKMAEAIRDIPITGRSDGGENYSLVYYHETRRPHGRLPVEQFDEAVKLTPRADYEAMSEDLQQVFEGLKELDRVVEERVCQSLMRLNGQHYKTLEEAKAAAGAFMPTSVESRAALEEVRVALEGILRKKRQEEARQPGLTAAAGELSEHAPSEGRAQAPSFLPRIEGQTTVNGSWRNAEELVRAGHVDKGLAEMTRLAAAEHNGRGRFHRRLMLAEICLTTKREKLATAILEELAEQIDKFQLENWESSALIGAVWSRLYRCYQNEQAGTADAERAAKLFDRLCRLDPWQALACSEGKYLSLGQASGS